MSRAPAKLDPTSSARQHDRACAALEHRRAPHPHPFEVAELNSWKIQVVHRRFLRSGPSAARSSAIREST